MHYIALWKRQSFSDKPCQALPQGVVPSFDVRRFSRLFPNGCVLFGRNHQLICRPKIRKTMPNSKDGGNLLPQLSTSALRALANGQKLPLAGFADTKQSKSTVCWLSARRMTIIDQVLKLAAGSVKQVFRLIPALVFFFLEPARNGVSGNPKGARQSTQTRTLLIGG